MARGDVIKVTLAPEIAPTTKKNRPQVFGRGPGAKAIILPSEQYLLWFESVLLEKPALKQALGDLIPITGPLSMQLRIFRKQASGDVFGFQDAVADAIQVDVWQCQNPATTVDKKGVRKSVCRKKTPSDAPLVRCPVCNWPAMKRSRKGLGLIMDDAQIIESHGFLDKDAADPRVEIVLKKLNLDQPNLFEASDAN